MKQPQQKSWYCGQKLRFDVLCGYVQCGYELCSIPIELQLEREGD